MTKTILLGFLILYYTQSFCQTDLSPINTASFGLNNQTNRDVAYFSHIDDKNNTFIVATTERDSTFTDILTTKIDENLNLIWQKRLSIPTNLSYDIPIKSFLDANNELYIFGRSGLNQSKSNGLLFIAKYGENGTLVYKKIIGNTDGSDFVDYGYFNAGLNNDGSLSVVYAPFVDQSYEANVFNFLKIDNQGNTIDSFQREIVHRDVIGLVDNGSFYLLSKEVLDESDNTFTYNFYRIKDANNQSVIKIADTVFTSFYTRASIDDDVKMTIDADNNVFLSCRNELGLSTDLRHKIHMTKISSNDEIIYAQETLDTDNYYLVDTYINEQNDNIIIANNLIENTTDFLNFDHNNELQTIAHIGDFISTGFKKNDDGSFFLTSNNSNVHLISNQLSLLKSFQTSDTYGLVDFSKMNENTIIAAGTIYDKMFPESDYYTQLDIQVEKINDAQIIGTYRYSGLGTSKAFQQRVIIDHDNNYLVLVTEKMGPEYLGIGGQNPPLNKRIIKYSPDLNVIWEVEIPAHIYNLVNHGGRDIDYFIDSKNDLYLNLPRPGDIGYFGLGYDLYKVTPDGEIEFINSSYLGDKFYANEASIFIASDYFTYDTSSKLYKLDKTTGKLLEEIDVGHEKIIEIFSIGTDDYFYTYEEISNNVIGFIYLYKNGEKLFTRNLPNNRGISYQVNEEGVLFFSTFYFSDRRMNKLDIHNSYSFTNVPDDVYRFKLFNNGNIFLFLRNTNTLILDKDLNFVSNGETINSSQPFLMAAGNYMLLGTSFENSIRVIDQNGVVINNFIINGFLHDWYSKFDHQGNLIMVGQFGNRYYTYNEYGWYRGFIHNYGNLDMVLNVEEIDASTQENNFWVYPNPTSNVLHIKTPNHSIEKVVLYNIAGKQLQDFNSNEIDLTYYKSGIYLLKVFTTNSVLTSKIIKN